MRTEPRRVLAGAIVVLALAVATAHAQDAILTGTDGNDVITGTPASESIYARAGIDVVNGGGGDDELDGGPGADVLNGGDGKDVVSYGGAAPVLVTLDGVANDGVAGEGDNVGADVEDIFAGDGPDKLTGSSKANTIDAGAGDDHVTGGGGRDTIFAGDGDDVIEARDGIVDRIYCGSGKDVATVDTNDITRACERLLRPPVTDRFDLTLRPRERILIVGSIDPISTIVIACVRGCHPRSSPTRALLRSNSVHGPLKRIRLPGRVTGATLEIGVTRRGARTTCRRVRIGARFASFVQQRSTTCTTVARSLA